jgi:hypothetical protein
MNTKYTFDENYFETIDTEEKAYWLGFIYADGNVFIKNGYRLTIGLQVQDYTHLLKFIKAIQSNHQLYFYTGPTNNILVRLVINSKKLCEDLIKLKCTPCKSLTLKFPTEEQVPISLMRHFIRGYFDGDGCLYTNIKHKTNLSLVGNFQFLTQYNDFLYRNLNIPHRKIDKHTDNCYQVAHHATNTVLLLANYLYKDATIYLDRKFDKYLWIINNKTYITKYKPTCSVMGCDKEHRAKGYCSYHYDISLKQRKNRTCHSQDLVC